MSTVLNPKNYSKPPLPDNRSQEKQKADQAQLDQGRFQKCFLLLTAKGFTSLPEYQNLIQSGTLHFLTQSSIELRNDANMDAHELIGMSDLRQYIDKARADNVINKVCSVKDLTGIEGVMNFLDSHQPKPTTSTSITTTTTKVIEIVTKTSVQ